MISATNISSELREPGAHGASSPTTVVWFRLDLRLGDNPALQAAVMRGGPVVPLFIWSPEEEGSWSPGAASRWWLHGSLSALDGSLRRLGSKLILRAGDSLAVLREVVRDTGANCVCWNRRYEPAMVARDRRVEMAMESLGIGVETFNSALLVEPWEVQTRAGRPYEVFSAYWRACLGSGLAVGPGSSSGNKAAGRRESDGPLPRRAREAENLWKPPAALQSPAQWPAGAPLDSLRLQPELDWAGGMAAAWVPGEAAARVALEDFAEGSLKKYATLRNQPGVAGTSRLSPYLHFGEISAWRVVDRIAPGMDYVGDGEVFVRELGWRDFAHHLLYHFPHTADQPLRVEFARFPWRRSARLLKAWQKGKTGYPLIDAGMRELWTTGWMHNRVRMAVASFLVKDLLIAWQEGARWFWDTLVDADLANNTLGWQWTAGCGADAAPFFRVFNPVLQGTRFDPAGDYVRRWVPELADLPEKWLHEPWSAPAMVLDGAKVRLGASYPRPVVDHGEARTRALEAFKAIRSGG